MSPAAQIQDQETTAGQTLADLVAYKAVRRYADAGLEYARVCLAQVEGYTLELEAIARARPDDDMAAEDARHCRGKRVPEARELLRRAERHHADMEGGHTLIYARHKNDCVHECASDIDMLATKCDMDVRHAEGVA